MIANTILDIYYNIPSTNLNGATLGSFLFLNNVLILLFLNIIITLGIISWQSCEGSKHEYISHVFYNWHLLLFLPQERQVRKERSWDQKGTVKISTWKHSKSDYLRHTQLVGQVQVITSTIKTSQIIPAYSYDLNSKKFLIRIPDAFIPKTTQPSIYIFDLAIKTGLPKQDVPPISLFQQHTQHSPHSRHSIMCNDNESLSTRNACYSTLSHSHCRQ